MELWFCFALALVALPATAFAYIDPGSGSAVLQAVIASLAAGLVALRLSFRRISAFFGRRGKGGTARAHEAEPGSKGSEGRRQ